MYLEYWAKRTGNLGLEGGSAPEEGAGMHLGGGAHGHLGGGGGTRGRVADGSHCVVCYVVTAHPWRGGEEESRFIRPVAEWVLVI